MSLILEALRKSEAERQRVQGPGLHAPVAPRPVRRVAPAWGPWVAAFVGAALLAGTWWIGRGDEPGGRAERPELATPAPSPAAPPTDVDSGLSALSPKPKPEPEQKVASPAPRVPEPPPEPRPRTDRVDPIEAPPSERVATPEPRAIAPPTPVPDPEPAPPPASESLPSLATLAPTEREALPPLKVSMFVWSPDPARRFAIVDGNRVGEGALLAGGTVVEIRQDGVVLELQGRRVLLARP